MSKAPIFVLFMSTTCPKRINLEH